MKIRSLLVATAMVLGLGSAAHASNFVRTVDSFDFLVDYSGSMMMTEKTTGMSKMALAKDVLAKINKAIPDLGYMSSMHTAAPASTVIPYGTWNMAATESAIDGLATDLAIFGRQTPLGDSLANFAQDYSAMARPTAVVIVSDGLNNFGDSPVEEAKLIMQTQPGLCFQIISFADTPEGQFTLEEIAGISDCSVIVNGLELYNNPEAVNEFVDAVFYDNLEADALVLRGINFAFDSSVLNDKSKGILSEVVALLDTAKNPVILQGWTDSTGSDAYNVILSTRRADAVQAYLIEKGAAAEGITTEGMGKSFKYDNKTADGRFLNRRVEIIIGK